MRLEWVVLAGAALIAGSILFIGRYEITAAGYGFSGGATAADTTDETVFRLDRWTGEIRTCSVNMNTNFVAQMKATGAAIVACNLPPEIVNRPSQ